MTRIVRITFGMAACLMLPLVVGCASGQPMFRAQSPEPALIQTAAFEEPVELPEPPEPQPLPGTEEAAPAPSAPCPQGANCPQHGQYQGGQCPPGAECHPGHGCPCPIPHPGMLCPAGYGHGGYGPGGYCPGPASGYVTNPNGYSAFGTARWIHPNSQPVGDWYPKHIERYYHHPPENLRYPTGPVPNAVVQYPYYTHRGPTDFFMQ